jgi:hypothetical protein
LPPEINQTRSSTPRIVFLSRRTAATPRLEKKNNDPLVDFFVESREKMHAEEQGAGEPISQLEEREGEINTAGRGSRRSRQSVDSGYDEEEMSVEKLGCELCCQSFVTEARLVEHMKMRHVPTRLDLSPHVLGVLALSFSAYILTYFETLSFVA